MGNRMNKHQSSTLGVYVRPDFPFKSNVSRVLARSLEIDGKLALLQLIAFSTRLNQYRQHRKENVLTVFQSSLPKASPMASQPHLSTHNSALAKKLMFRVPQCAAHGPNCPNCSVLFLIRKISFKERLDERVLLQARVTDNSTRRSHHIPCLHGKAFFRTTFPITPFREVTVNVWSEIYRF